jgi:hypothetical protein
MLQKTDQSKLLGLGMVARGPFRKMSGAALRGLALDRTYTTWRGKRNGTPVPPAKVRFMARQRAPETPFRRSTLLMPMSETAVCSTVTVPS